MIRLFKVLVSLCVLGLLGLIGYAYLGDLSPSTEEIRMPVDLDGD